MYKEMLTQVYY